MRDYFFENYRLADFYDDQYGNIQHDIPFWRNMTNDSQEILEIACGTGRITIPLLLNKKKVHAIDYSSEMISILHNKIDTDFPLLKDQLEITNADMRNFDLNKKFDTIIITSNSLNHIETNQDVVRTLQTMKKHLTDDGILVFDILNPKFNFLIRDPNGIYDEEILPYTKSNTFFKTWENNIYSPSEQINYVTYYYQFCDEHGNSTNDEIKKMKLKVRLFFPKEMDFVIESSGFKIINKFDWYDHREWSGKTGEQIYVLKMR